MKTRKFLAAFGALGLLGVGLTACATGFQADVSRFQSKLPAPQGQTFAVVADDPALTGGLEFSQYADLVTQKMATLGYIPGTPQSADLLVRFDYGVDDGRERIVDSGLRDPFFDPWYRYRPRYYRTRDGRIFAVRDRAWGYGFHDSFFRGNDLRSYTVYTSDIELQIDDRATGERLFEGTAEAMSRSKRLQYLVPNLVEAMFTDFPGNSGEAVRISIKPEDQ